jgi:hypothetical protein
MSYLNPPYKDTFQELCAAMPLFYLDVLEMREVLKAQGRLMDDVCNGFELIIDNNFIQTADATTIQKWEDVLGITSDAKLTLDQRKSVIASYICGYGHIGEPEIREIVGQYTQNSMTLAFSNGIITVTIDGNVLNLITLLNALYMRVPAHLQLKIVLQHGAKVQVILSSTRQQRFSYSHSMEETPIDIALDWLVDENAAVLLDENNNELII